MHRRRSSTSLFLLFMFLLLQSAEYSDLLMHCTASVIQQFQKGKRMRLMFSLACSKQCYIVI